MLCPTKESYPSSPEGGMNDNSLILLGKRIRELRVKHGLSQEKLSELSGISSRHISEMERGESNPSFQVMEQLTFALGVSMKEFFDFEHHADDEAIRDELCRMLVGFSRPNLQLAYKLLRELSDG